MTLKDIIRTAVRERTKTAIVAELARLGVAIQLRDTAADALMRIKRDNLLDLVDKIYEIYDTVHKEVTEDIRAFVGEEKNEQ